MKEIFICNVETVEHERFSMSSGKASERISSRLDTGRCVLLIGSGRLTDSFLYYIKHKANNIVYQNVNLLTLTNALILTNKLHGYCRLDFGSEKVNLAAI